MPPAWIDSIRYSRLPQFTEQIRSNYNVFSVVSAAGTEWDVTLQPETEGRTRLMAESLVFLT